MTTKQRRFVDEYLIDNNGAQAAARAGYTARTRTRGTTTVRDLMAVPAVAAAIAAGQAKLAQKSALTAEWVLGELRTNHELARGLEEMAASNKALELLGKHIGMFSDRVEHSGPGGGPVQHSIEVTIVDPSEPGDGKDPG